MSKTKSVSTVQSIKLEGKEAGLIMQDEAGYFYRPKGKSGLHNPKWDGEHFPTVAAVMASVNGDPQATQATAEPVKGAKAGHGKAQPQKTPPAASKEVTEATPPGRAPGISPAKEKAAPVPAVAAAPVGASKVVHKLVETVGALGSHFWLYAGYQHESGLKWNASGGFMFINREAADKFLSLNSIAITGEVEKVDVTGGHFDPNKGVVPHYKPGQQTLSL